MPNDFEAAETELGTWATFNRLQTLSSDSASSKLFRFPDFSTPQSVIALFFHGGVEKTMMPNDFEAAETELGTWATFNRLQTLSSDSASSKLFRFPDFSTPPSVFALFLHGGVEKTRMPNDFEAAETELGTWATFDRLQTLRSDSASSKLFRFPDFSTPQSVIALFFHGGVEKTMMPNDFEAAETELGTWATFNRLQTLSSDSASSKLFRFPDFSTPPSVFALFLHGGVEKTRMPNDFEAAETELGTWATFDRLQTLRSDSASSKLFRFPDFSTPPSVFALFLHGGVEKTRMPNDFEAAETELGTWATFDRLQTLSSDSASSKLFRFQDSSTPQSVIALFFHGGVEKTMMPNDFEAAETELGTWATFNRLQTLSSDSASSKLFRFPDFSTPPSVFALFLHGGVEKTRMPNDFEAAETELGTWATFDRLQTLRSDSASSKLFRFPDFSTPPSVFALFLHCGVEKTRMPNDFEAAETELGTWATFDRLQTLSSDSASSKLFRSPDFSTPQSVIALFFHGGVEKTMMPNDFEAAETELGTWATFNRLQTLSSDSASSKLFRFPDFSTPPSVFALFLHGGVEKTRMPNDFEAAETELGTWATFNRLQTLSSDSASSKLFRFPDFSTPPSVFALFLHGGVEKTRMPNDFEAAETELGTWATFNRLQTLSSDSASSKLFRFPDFSTPPSVFALFLHGGVEKTRMPNDFEAAETELGTWATFDRLQTLRSDSASSKLFRFPDFSTPPSVFALFLHGGDEKTRMPNDFEAAETELGTWATFNRLQTLSSDSASSKLFRLPDFSTPPSVFAVFLHGGVEKTRMPNDFEAAETELGTWATFDRLQTLRSDSASSKLFRFPDFSTPTGVFALFLHGGVEKTRMPNDFEAAETERGTWATFDRLQTLSSDSASLKLFRFPDFSTPPSVFALFLHGGVEKTRMPNDSEADA